MRSLASLETRTLLFPVITRDLRRRLAVAALGIPLGIAVIYLGDWWVAGVMALIAALGTAEVYRLAEARGTRPFRWVGILASAFLVLSAAWTGSVAAWSTWGWASLLAVALACLVAAVFRGRTERGPLAAVAATVLGVVYVGATLSFAVHLRAFPEVSDGVAGWGGAFLLIFVLTGTWCGDAAAYFAGRRWGRRKLLPSVSPSKTVEGAIGGLVGAAAAAALFTFVLADPMEGPPLPVLGAAVLGLLLGGVAQLGDLVESVLKREAGVKDSGTLIPGHGGILDRFDAVLFTVPLAYLLLPLFLP